MSKKKQSPLVETSSEFERIEHISKILNRGRGPQITLGIGDDAAIIRIGREQLVWTTDSSVQDVHFRCDLMSYGDVGWRSFHAAASDIAAMGADALAALSALELPEGLPDRSLYELVEGQAAASKRLACPVAGGNLALGNKIAITTSVLGRIKAPLLRRGAQPTDEIWLVGAVGLAAAGLACLLRGKQRPRGEAVDRCIEAFRRPEALLKRGKDLVGRATAVIDVSDGLAGDAIHVAASSAVALVVDEAMLARCLSKELVVVSGKLGQRAIDFALRGGEDYSLLATGPRAKRPRYAKAIGHVEKGRGAWLMDAEGQRLPLGPGFDHFRKRTTGSS